MPHASQQSQSQSASGHFPGYQTDGFYDEMFLPDGMPRTRAELLSTKSAYLWSANRAHPWCDRLLAVIRDKTRIEGLGFSVGVFTSTMQAMPGYTDLNTNGVILTAIDHVLR